MPQKRLRSLEDRVAYRVNRSKRTVFLRDDFGDMAGYDQVGRALKALVRKDKLVKLGYGLYARPKVSAVSGKLILEKPLPQIAAEALERLGVEVSESASQKKYNMGRSTQVPTGRVIAVKGRTSRVIGYDGKSVHLERSTA